jgi:hypothetical protein
MGSAWQQGPLAINTVGHSLTPEPFAAAAVVR